ncbi:hypothetical protein ACROYT_G005698 [Oculina patagonica]
MAIQRQQPQTEKREEGQSKMCNDLQKRERRPCRRERQSHRLLPHHRSPPQEEKHPDKTRQKSATRPATAPGRAKRTEAERRSDRTNVCWVKEGCSSLKPAACSSLPLEVVDQADVFDVNKLNLHLSTGCFSGPSGNATNLQAQLNNAPASCNPPCFRITKPGEYCYMSTRNNNFSNRRHMGQITVT